MFKYSLYPFSFSVIVAKQEVLLSLSFAGLVNTCIKNNYDENVITVLLKWIESVKMVRTDVYKCQYGGM